MLEYLAFWPVLHFVVIFIISKIHNKLDLLFNIYAIMYLDWLFVPFNFFITSAAVFSWKLFFILLLISLIVIIFVHKKWQKNDDVSSKSKRIRTYFIDKKGLTLEGWTHFVFMVVQAAIVITALLSFALSVKYIYALICLFAYLIGYLLIVKYIRKDLNGRVEIPFVLLGIFAVIIRLIVYFSGRG
jgi:hypothetical protein